MPVFSGNHAGNVVLSETDNLAVGKALQANTIGDNNTGVGANALLANTTGDNNTAVGANALLVNTASDNTAVGMNALRVNNRSDNTAVGRNAGVINVTGSGNVFIGNEAGAQETGSDKFYIDNTNTTTPLIGGDFSARTLTIAAALTLSGSSFTYNDDVKALFGGVASLQWETGDANANYLQVQLPAGGGVDVPVIVIGEALDGVDLGLYDGVVDPLLALMGAGAVTTAPVLDFRKARGTLGSPTVITSGDDIGSIRAFGYSGAAGYVQAAAIEFDTGGTIATTRVGGVIRLRTGTDAAPTVLTTRLTIGSAGNATFSDGVIINGATGNSLTVDTSTFVVDASNNRVGIGLTAPSVALEVYSTTDYQAQIAVTAVPASDTAGVAGYVNLQRARAGPANVANGDVLGTFNWQGYFGGAYRGAASINASVQGTPAGTNVPAGFAFVVNGDAFLTALTITPAGNILIPAGSIMIGDTSNANMASGFTVNQLTADNQLLAGKSSDIAHGLTSGGTVAAETDDYVSMQKFSATLGGLLLASFQEDPAGAQVAMAIDAFGGQAATGPSTTNENLFIIRAAEHDGANALVDAPANSQIFGIQRRVAGAWNNAFVVDEDGDLFVDGNIVTTAFDAWDDVALVRAFDQSRSDQLIRSRWDDYVHYNQADLQRAGILSTPTDAGRAMVNVTQLQRLHNGAIWQLGMKAMSHEERIEYLEQDNKALRQELRALRGA